MTRKKGIPNTPLSKVCVLCIQIVKLARLLSESNTLIAIIGIPNRSVFVYLL